MAATAVIAIAAVRMVADAGSRGPGFFYRCEGLGDTRVDVVNQAHEPSRAVAIVVPLFHLATIAFLF